MKMNLFLEEVILTENRGDDENRRRSIGVHKAIDVFDPEETLIEDIDKPKYSPEQYRAKKFIEFLGNRRLNMHKLRQLDIEEQVRLKKEFMESFEA